MVRTYRGKKAKGYSKNTRDGKYTVRKYLNGESVSFGIVPTEEEAIRYVKALEKCNYNTSELPEEFKKYLPVKKEGEPKFYHKKGDAYLVTKRIDGGNVYYGSFPSEELAKQAVIELKKVDWDLNKFNAKQFQSYSNQAKLKKFLKKSAAYKKHNPTGSLSNPIYDNVEIESAGSLRGTYNQLKEQKRI